MPQTVVACEPAQNGSTICTNLLNTWMSHVLMGWLIHAFVFAYGYRLLTRLLIIIR